MTTCKVNIYSSRCCSLGTKGCIEEHKMTVKKEEELSIGDFVICSSYQGFFIITQLIFDDFDDDSVVAELRKVVHQTGTVSGNIIRYSELKHCTKLDKNMINEFCLEIIKGVDRLRDNLMEYVSK